MEHPSCGRWPIVYKQAGDGGFELVFTTLIKLYWTSDIFEMKWLSPWPNLPITLADNTDNQNVWKLVYMMDIPR